LSSGFFVDQFALFSSYSLCETLKIILCCRVSPPFASSFLLAVDFFFLFLLDDPIWFARSLLGPFSGPAVTTGSTLSFFFFFFFQGPAHGWRGAFFPFADQGNSSLFHGSCGYPRAINFFFFFFCLFAFFFFSPFLQCRGFAPNLIFGHTVRLSATGRGISQFFCI